MWHFESQGGSNCVAFCDAIPLSANTDFFGIIVSTEVSLSRLFVFYLLQCCA